MAFYLKYRSQTVSELDISSVRDGLANILQAKNPPHALLFTGPRGTGKTSSARILAKAINCKNHKQASKNTNLKKHQKSSFEPCNQCSACKSVTVGNALDVIEIDAASHRGIDDIRDLREKVGLAPSDLEYKVYIIDEVHMLTTEAFNALLKTLEEPPDNVIFILCTTELHKLPQTIVSRCIKLNFTKASQSDLVHSLNRVIKGEKIDITDQAITLIAKNADGSFRDAHKILEQLSWENKKITAETVNKFIGLSTDHANQIISLLSQNNILNTIQLIEKLENEGQNIKVIFQQVIEKLHLELLSLHEVKSENHKKNNFNKNDVTKLNLLIDLLNKSLSEIKYSHIQQLPIEIAIIKWQKLAHQNQITPTASKQTQAFTTSENVSNQTTPPSTSSKTTDPKPKQSQQLTQDTTQSTQPVPLTKSVASELSLETLLKHWDQLLEAVKPKNHSIQALLRASKPQSVEGNQISIEVWYPFHYERLNSIKPRQIVEQTICDMFNCSSVKLDYRLGTRDSKPKNPNSNMISETEITKSVIKRPKVARDTSGTKYQPRKPSSPPPTEEDDELIKFAEEIFGG